MNRYQQNTQLTPGIYAPDCPMIISEAALLRSPEGEAQVRLRLENLTSRVISGALAEVTCLDATGLVLAAENYPLEGTCFAGECLVLGPAALPAADTALINVRILRVNYMDGSAWEGTAEPWEPLPLPRTVESVFQDPELARAYKEAIGEPCVQAPRMHRGLFLCACGTVNGDEDAPCRGCGRTFPELAGAMNPEFLKGRLEETRRREEAFRQKQQAREEARQQQRREEKQSHRKEAGKFFLIALIVVILVGALAVLVPKVILPRLKNEQAMDRAAALVEQGAYDEASAAYLALGDYKNARELAKDALYRKAEELRTQGRYQESVEQFTQLGDYSDSADQAEETLLQWKEADYQAARDLVNSGAYPAAAAAFEALGDYRDAAQWVVECQMLQREDDYSRACEAMDRGDYLEAVRLFEDLRDYRESRKLAEECKLLQKQRDYAEATALLEAKDYAAAEEAFKALGSYEDSEALLLEARYGLGCQLLQQEQYEKAIEKLQLCGDYQNTDWNLKNAKMGYAKTHKDRNDAKTLEYLKELKAIYFQGAKNLYDEIFGWKVEITSFSNKEWGENQETVSKYGVIYIHFKLTGGEPGQTTTIRTLLTVPGGNRGTVYHNDVKDGYAGYSSFWFHDPDRAPTGTLTFQAYDEAGKLLCTGSVKVTK